MIEACDHYAWTSALDGTVRVHSLAVGFSGHPISELRRRACRGALRERVGVSDHRKRERHVPESETKSQSAGEGQRPPEQGQSIPQNQSLSIAARRGDSRRRGVRRRSKPIHISTLTWLQEQNRVTQMLHDNGYQSVKAKVIGDTVT